MSELLFGFRDLPNIRDPNRNVLLNIGSFFMNDEYVRKFNQKRYSFYIKFLSGLSNPNNLYRFMYKTNESKVYHEELAGQIKKITESLSKMNAKQRERVVNNLKTIVENKDSDKYSELFTSIKNYATTTTGGGNKISKKSLLGGDAEYYINKRFMPMESLIESVHAVDPLIGKVPPKTIDEIIINSNPSDKNIKHSVTGKDSSSLTHTNDDATVEKIKGIYQNYKDNVEFSPDRINVVFMDRLMFILATFILRLISLSLVYWGLNSNLINNFKTAFMYYCLIYILFFAFVIGLVNIIYYYPIFELFGNTSLKILPNYLYYFYIHINGINRLLLHIIIILMLLFIPFVLTLDTTKKRMEDDNKNISYNYKKKEQIYKTISNFSLVIFVLTSLVAFNY